MNALSSGWQISLEMRRATVKQCWPTGECLLPLPPSPSSSSPFLPNCLQTEQWLPSYLHT